VPRREVRSRRRSHRAFRWTIGMRRKQFLHRLRRTFHQWPAALVVRCHGDRNLAPAFVQALQVHDHAACIGIKQLLALAALLQQPEKLGIRERLALAGAARRFPAPGWPGFRRIRRRPDPRFRRGAPETGFCSWRYRRISVAVLSWGCGQASISLATREILNSLQNPASPRHQWVRPNVWRIAPSLR